MPKDQHEEMIDQIFNGPQPFSVKIDTDDWFELEIRKARISGREEEATRLEIEWEAAKSNPAVIREEGDEPVFRFLIKG